METYNIELTPGQKGVLAALSEETGESVEALIDKALDELQEHLRTRRANGQSDRKQNEKRHVPIWEQIRDGFANVPEEEIEELPTDGAAQVDHYAYGLPKR